MNLLFSFILTVIVYIFIVVFLFFLVIPKEKKVQKRVYIHTVIIPKKTRVIKKNNKIIHASKKRVIGFSKKNSQKIGSKSNKTVGGEKIGFNDIFKNVDYNITTEKIVLEEQSGMSRLKGVKSNLKSLRSFNINLVQNSGKELTDKEYSEIEYKLYNIWDSVSTLVIDYAEVKITNKNGKTYVAILNSNLALNKQNELIRKIESEKFNEEFDLTVLFQSKERND